MLGSMARAGTAVAAAAVTMVLFAALKGGAPAAVAGVKIPEPAVDQPLAQRPGQETAVVSGGCFWGMQAVFQHVKGVTNATAGYAESVQITYDPSQISYGQLLKVFFSVAHDPTELDRQGPDEGTQYRSAIWFANADQQRIAHAYIAQLGAAHVFGQPIVTEVTPLKGFYAAEGYHQNYYNLHPYSPYIVVNDKPKVAHLQSDWPQLYR